MSCASSQSLLRRSCDIVSMEYVPLYPSLLSLFRSSFFILLVSSALCPARWRTYTYTRPYLCVICRSFIALRENSHEKEREKERESERREKRERRKWQLYQDRQGSASSTLHQQFRLLINRLTNYVFFLFFLFAMHRH